MFTCQLGKDGPELKAHEFTLKRSPVLVELIQKARTNKRVAKHEILYLMAHDKTAFEQMLCYLYTDKFQLSKNKSTTARLDELKELMSLAKHYRLPDLQKQVVQVFKTSKLITQVPRAKFFDWAEDMYYEELDHENGPFKTYLSIVGPTLLKGMDETCKRSVAAMVNQGGGFAEQLFIAATTVGSFMLGNLPIYRLIHPGIRPADKPQCRQERRSDATKPLSASPSCPQSQGQTAYSSRYSWANIIRIKGRDHRRWRKLVRFVWASHPVSLILIYDTVRN